MKSVKRWRYYCDHCKKAGNSSFHMKNHESACTLNPERDCRMCVLIQGGCSATMDEMLAVLPDPALHMVAHKDYKEPQIDADAFRPLLSAALLVLREMVENCPACILAALRQKKIPVHVADDFDFKAEMKSEFEDATRRGNEERAAICGYGIGGY